MTGPVGLCQSDRRVDRCEAGRHTGPEADATHIGG